MGAPRFPRHLACCKHGSHSYHMEAETNGETAGQSDDLLFHARTDAAKDITSVLSCLIISNKKVRLSCCCSPLRHFALRRIALLFLLIIQCCFAQSIRK